MLTAGWAASAIAAAVVVASASSAMRRRRDLRCASMPLPSWTGGACRAGGVVVGVGRVATNLTPERARQNVRRAEGRVHSPGKMFGVMLVVAAGSRAGARGGDGTADDQVRARHRL